MSLVRLSTFRFAPSDAGEGERLIRQIMSLCEGQPGYLGGMLLKDHGNSNHIARIGIWVDRHAADHVAQLSALQAARSRINTLSSDVEHTEDTYDLIDGDDFVKKLSS